MAARCPDGHPCVVTTYPLRRRGPSVAVFPTLYWLTCPRLCKLVSHLERDGVIAAVQAELDGDAAMRARLGREHEEYIARRWAMLLPADRAVVAERGLGEELRGRGIGGMTNRAAVKCLHLHVAYHLVSGNVIGEWVMERYGVRGCAAER